MKNMISVISSRLYRTAILFSALVAAYSCGPAPARISSPDKSISVGVEINEGVPYYNVSYKGKALVGKSRLLMFAEGLNLHD